MNDSRVLDIGCGPNKSPGAFGIDHSPFPGVDLVHDLTVRPWPLGDGCFDRVIASHIIEHVEDIPALFEEIYRVAADGAEVVVTTPHFTNRSSYLDPTHRHHLSARFAEFLAEGAKWHPSGSFAVTRSFLLQHHHDATPLLRPGMFVLNSVHLSFSRLFRWIGIEALANAKIDFYEFYLAFRFPARDITAKLCVRK